MQQRKWGDSFGCLTHLWECHVRSSYSLAHLRVGRYIFLSFIFFSLCYGRFSCQTFHEAHKLWGEGLWRLDPHQWWGPTTHGRDCLFTRYIFNNKWLGTVWKDSCLWHGILQLVTSSTKYCSAFQLLSVHAWKEGVSVQPVDSQGYPRWAWQSLYSWPPFWSLVSTVSHISGFLSWVCLVAAHILTQELTTIKLS